jgi:hypothetical protein
MPMKTDELKKLLEATTPEGWHIYGRDGCAHLLFIGGPRGRQRPVAQIEPIPRKYQGTEIQFDNARLIAAAPDLAREVIALREAAGDVVKKHDAWQHAIDHADYGSESGAKREFGYALAALRAVLGENE